jgi:riboflavin kinase/FMN adenylyltransferase
MRRLRGLDQYPADAAPAVVAQGTFDGMHLGHQAVIRRAVERARALRAQAVAVTFDPVPMAVLRPSEPATAILPVDERLARIAELGADAALVIPFTPEFSRVEADVYVRDILVGLLRAREVVVGFNHTFGRGARGTPEFLVRMGEVLGIAVHVVPPLAVDGVLVSSSAVRDALRAGDVRRASALLGRPYDVRGRVVRGAARGHALGFPTANLQPEATWLLATGVYAGRAVWGHEASGAVINVGIRPTFGESRLLVEAHLLDVVVDLYDRPLRLEFLARIREERRFPSVDALRHQIGADVRAARTILGGRG